MLTGAPAISYKFKTPREKLTVLSSDVPAGLGADVEVLADFDDAPSSSPSV